MVRGSVNRRDFVCPCRKTVRHVCTEDTINGCIIQPLEERELGRVGRCRLRERAQLLDNDMGVPLNLPLRVQLLGCGKVVLLSVHKMACLHALNSERDGKCLVWRNDVKVLRVGEFSGGHVRRRGDRTHGCGVAGSARDLLPIGDRLIGDRQAEVDEVVRRSERRDLAGSRLSLAIILEAFRDDRGIKSWMKYEEI